jgi:hypothetical protein
MAEMTSWDFTKRRYLVLKIALAFPIICFYASTTARR